jgi:ABC-type transport system involved in multi-copper enzyme maturation permease subunit
MSFRSENRGGTWRFLRALPASGSVIVSAKVVGALLVLGAGSVASLTGLMIADGSGNLIHAARTLSLPVIFGLGLLGLNFALCFRFGERHASLALLAILATLQITGMLQLALAPGGGIRILLESIERWLLWAATPMGLMVCGAASLGVLALGWLASIRIYDARDITHAM